MKTVKRASNWGYWDELDGVRLRSAERIAVRFPSGKMELCTVEIDHRTFQASEQGGSSKCDDDRAFVTVLTDYGPAIVYILGLKAEREST